MDDVFSSDSSSQGSLVAPGGERAHSRVQWLAECNGAVVPGNCTPVYLHLYPIHQRLALPVVLRTTFAAPSALPCRCVARARCPGATGAVRLFGRIGVWAVGAEAEWVA